MSRNCNSNLRARTHSASAFEALESRQLMSGGTMDPTLGQGGKVYTDFGFTANDIAVQVDGKIVMVGSLDRDFAIARLNIDGSPDKSFGRGTGLVTTDLAGESADVPDKVVIQPDGKIVVGGRKMKGERNGQFVFVRYNTDGRLDNTFDDDGKATAFDRMDLSAIGGLALQPDGKIVFTGGHYQSHLNFTNPGRHYDLRTARLSPDGSVDKTFGQRINGNRATGYIENDFDGQDQPSGLLIQPDGKIVVGGNSYRDNNSRFIFTRYNAVGLPDKSFDGDGKMSTKFTATGGTLKSIALQADGKLVAAGMSNGKMTLVRYNPNGSVDPYFGAGGVVFSDPSSGNDTISSVFALPTGKILAVGSIPGAPVVAQFESTGQPDTSFANNGQSTIYGANLSVTSAARMPDGRVVIAGASGGSTGVVRLVNAPVQAGVYPWVEGASETAGSKSGAIIVARDGVYNFPTRVWFTIGGNATPLVDYGGDFALVQTSPPRGYVDIPAHQSFVMVPIRAREDSALEPAETATFTLIEDSAYSGGTGVFASVTIADNDALNVNFQGPTPGTVGNYRPDRGEVFGDHLGVGYGWDADNSGNARNRSNRRSPDFRYDSLNHMQRPGQNRKWEVAVPNGLYLVTLVAGDPSNIDSVYKMNLEGKLALSGTPSGDTRWFMSTLNVQVNDGRLTLSNAAGSKNNKVCFIDIQAAAPGASAGPVRLNAPIRLENPPPAAAPRTRTSAPKPIARTLFSDEPLKEVMPA